MRVRESAIGRCDECVVGIEAVAVGVGVAEKERAKLARSWLLQARYILHQEPLVCERAMLAAIIEPREMRLTLPSEIGGVGEPRGLLCQVLMDRGYQSRGRFERHEKADGDKYLQTEPPYKGDSILLRHCSSHGW
jgi:hypothetical protein